MFTPTSTTVDAVYGWSSVARLAVRTVVVATRPAPGATRVQPQFDEPSRDAGVGEPVERRPREVSGELDEREVRPDLDRPEVVALEAALVGERPDDLARLDAMAFADGDPVRRHSRPGCARPALTPVAIAVEAPGPLATVAVRRLRIRLEQKRRLTLGDHGEGGRDIHFGNVVVAHVVGDDVAET